MNVDKIRPKGPWVLIKIQPLAKKRGEIYLPQGNLAERVGHATGIVLRVGDGHLNNDKVIKRTGKKYSPSELKKGDRILFRGYLQEANKVQIFDREHCLLHLDDIIGVVEKKAVLTDGERL